MSARVQFWATMITVGGLVILGYDWCKGVDEKAAAEARQREEKQRQDTEKAKREDEEVRQRAAAAEKERQTEKAAREAVLTAKYKALQPWQRLAEVQRLCPRSPPPDAPPRTIEEMLAGVCVTDASIALVAAVQGTAEEKILKEALAVAAKRRDESDRQRSRFAKCCDGAPSDCMCSNVHQGCCSHHGGVCGCE